jgi:hypothetical protein
LMTALRASRANSSPHEAAFFCVRSTGPLPLAAGSQLERADVMDVLVMPSAGRYHLERLIVSRMMQVEVGG